jgi:hypothetical protein
MCSAVYKSKDRLSKVVTQELEKNKEIKRGNSEHAIHTLGNKNSLYIYSFSFM